MALTKIPANLLDKSAHVDFADNEQLRLGSGNDGTIHHDGTHFRLRAATGNFNVQTNDFHITDAANGSVRFVVDHDGETRLYYNGGIKLQTTNTGISVNEGKLTISEVTGSDAYTQIRKTNTGSNLAIVSQESIYMMLDENNDQTNRSFQVKKNAGAPGSGSALFVVEESGDSTVYGNLAVTGDLNITGDINSVSVTDLDVTDKTITLGKGQTESASGGSGIIIDGSSASMLWDESNGEFDFNNPLSIVNSIGGDTVLNLTGSYGAGNNVALLGFARSGGAVSGDIRYVDASTDMEIGTGTAHAFSLKTSGTRRLIINSSGDIGIGQSPSTNYKLIVVGTNTNGARTLKVKAPNSPTSIGSTAGHIEIENTNSTTNNYTKLSFLSANAGETVSLLSQNTDHSNHYGDFVVNTRGSDGYVEKFRITSNGKSGFGTSSPGYVLEVSDENLPNHYSNRRITVKSINHGQNVGYRFDAEDSNGTNRSAGYYFQPMDPTAGDSYLGLSADDSATHMSVNSQGNVGIGTTAGTADFRFHVKHPTTNVVGRFESGDNQVWIDLHDDGSGAYGALLGHDSDAGKLFMVADASVSQKFVIKNDGKVGIGMTDDPAYTLEVKKTVNNNWISRIYNTGSTDASGLLVRSDTAASQATAVLGVYSDGAYRLMVRGDGNVGIGTSNPGHPLHIVESADGAKLRLARGGVSEWDFSISNTSTLTGVGSGALEILPQNANTANEFAIGTAGSTAPLVHITNSQINLKKNTVVTGNVSSSGTNSTIDAGRRVTAKVQDMINIGGDDWNAISRYYNNFGYGTGGSLGGYSVNLTDGQNSGWYAGLTFQGYVTWIPDVYIPYSIGQVYGLSASFFQHANKTAGTAVQYVGCIGYDTNFNFMNHDAIGTYQYNLSSSATYPAGSTTTVDVTLKGWQGNGQSDGNKMDRGTVYIRPMMLINYPWSSASGGTTPVTTLQSFTMGPKHTISDNDSNAGTNY